jgi:hypothetical protein
MPARKSIALITAKESKENLERRAMLEASMTPREPLEVDPPARLKKHKTASEIWTRTIALYISIDGQIVTAFDRDLLIKYCLLEEELLWLEDRREKVDEEASAIEKMTKKRPGVKDSDERWKAYLGLLKQYSAVLARVQGYDARIDGKRKLSHQIAQSLYLTPRSRAGVAPPEKDLPKPKNPMEELLDD